MKWKCDACGTVHRSNPSRCSNCGHTVLSQHGTADTSSGLPRWVLVPLLVLLLVLGYWFGLGAVL